jgi:hypothetical protein
MSKRKKPTSNAVEILHLRYYAGKPKRIAPLEEERIYVKKGVPNPVHCKSSEKPVRSNL